MMQPPQIRNTYAVILAGGQSKRMGENKATLYWRGDRLIDHSLKRLTSQVQRVLVSTNQTLPDLPTGIPQLADTLENAGPLSGVLAGLEWLQPQPQIPRENIQPRKDESLDQPEWLLSVAVDTPLIPTTLLSELAEHWRPNLAVLASHYQQRRHPTCALWHRSLTPILREYLDQGERRLMRFIEQQTHTYVAFDHHKEDPFINLNTPASLTASAP